MVWDFTAFDRSVIADRDPSDGSDEEAEKRGLVHGGIHPLNGYLVVQRNSQNYACLFSILFRDLTALPLL